MFEFTEPGFILYYLWFGLAPIILFAWCFYNQKISPVPGSCKELILEPDPTKKKSTERLAWQTGYKIHPVGNMVNFLTMTTVLGIFATMMWLIIQYYLQQEAIAWGWVTARFEGEVQVLLCYILVWLYGFFFVFSLKFPYSIRSLRLRRCDLAEADYVAPMCGHFVQDIYPGRCQSHLVSCVLMI